MTDVFFSYASEDRDKVRLAHDAIHDLGFGIFWDQKTPPGTDWESWIRAELKNSRSALVFWTAASIASRNVRQEAKIADEDGKLLQVFLTPVQPTDLPMGLYTQQAIDLTTWNGATDDQAFQRLLTELERKVASRWATRKITSLETTILTQKKMLALAESHEAELTSRFAAEATTHRTTRIERDEARSALSASAVEIATLKTDKKRAEQAIPELELKLREALVARDEAQAALNLQTEKTNVRSEQEALLEARIDRTMRKAKWGAVVAALSALLLGFAIGQAGLIGLTVHGQQVAELASKARAQLAENERLGKDLQVARTQLEELQKERQKLSSDLQVARGLADINWFDAAAALRAAREKQETEKK